MVRDIDNITALEELRKINQNLEDLKPRSNIIKQFIKNGKID